MPQGFLHCPGCSCETPGTTLLPLSFTASCVLCIAVASAAQGCGTVRGKAGSLLTSHGQGGQELCLARVPEAWGLCSRGMMCGIYPSRLQFFPSLGRDVWGYLKGVGSVKAHSVSSVLRKAGDVLSHVISVFAICSFLSPVPALQQVVMRSFPACRQLRIHFLWQKEATKAVLAAVSLSSAPRLQLAALAVGLALLPREPCYNQNNNNNPG